MRLVSLLVHIAALIACCSSSPLHPILNPPFTPTTPSRLIRGWTVQGMSANRWSGATLIQDQQLWVAIALQGQPIPTATPADLAPFNVTGQAPRLIKQVAAAGAGRAWLLTSLIGDTSSHHHEYQYVDLATGAVLTNVSHAALGRDSHQNIAVACDSASTLFIVAAPDVWLLSTAGEVLGHFNVSSTGFWLDDFLSVDVDSAGSLWLLGQMWDAGYFYFQLSHFTATGQLLSSQRLNMTELVQYPTTIQLAVDDTGIAYIAASMTEYVMTFNTSSNRRGDNIPSPLLQSVYGDWATISLLNDSILLVTSATPMHDGAIEALDTRTRLPAFNVTNHGPNLYNANWIQASGGQLLQLDEAPQDTDGGRSGLQAIDADSGAVVSLFPSPPTEWDISYDGLATDSEGNVWVSAQFQDRGAQHKQWVLLRYTRDAHFIGSFNVSLRGQLAVDNAAGVCWITAGIWAPYTNVDVVAVNMSTGAQLITFNVRRAFGYSPLLSRHTAARA